MAGCRVVEEGIDGERSRPAWSGTHDDIRTLAEDLERHFAPLRLAEEEATRNRMSGRRPEYVASEVEAGQRRWRTEAELRWQDRNHDILSATGTVDEILDKVKSLDTPPLSLELKIAGHRYGFFPVARVSLHRSRGARVTTERGQQPYARLALDAIEQRLDRRQSGSLWLLRPFPLRAAQQFVVYLMIFTAYVTVDRRNLVLFLSILAVIILLNVISASVLTRWQQRLPRFELRAPGQPDALTAIQRGARRVVLGTVSAAAVNILTSAVSLSK